MVVGVRDREFPLFFRLLQPQEVIALTLCVLSKKKGVVSEHWDGLRFVGEFLLYCACCKVMKMYKCPSYMDLPMH